VTVRQMFRYVVPVDDRPHRIELTGGPVKVAARKLGGEHVVEFWAEHDPSMTAHLRAFRVFGTGHPLPDEAAWCGTCDRTPDGFVWHLFEVKP
jgi:hypothetical protein